VVQRADCREFRVAADIDPVYDLAFRDARAAGVEMLCYYCAVNLEGIEIAAPLAISSGVG